MTVFLSFLPDRHLFEGGELIYIYLEGMVFITGGVYLLLSLI